MDGVARPLVSLVCVADVGAGGAVCHFRFSCTTSTTRRTFFSCRFSLATFRMTSIAIKWAAANSRSFKNQDKATEISDAVAFGNNPDNWTFGVNILPLG